MNDDFDNAKLDKAMLDKVKRALTEMHRANNFLTLGEYRHAICIMKKIICTLTNDPTILSLVCSFDDTLDDRTWYDCLQSFAEHGEVMDIKEEVK